MFCKRRSLGQEKKIIIMNEEEKNWRENQKFCDASPQFVNHKTLFLWSKNFFPMENFFLSSHQNNIFSHFKRREKKMLKQRIYIWEKKEYEKNTSYL